MLRFHSISAQHSEADSRINNWFIRMVKPAHGREGVPPADQTGSPVRERYAPMHRLLSADDDRYLEREGAGKIRKRLRQQHRRCYFGYLRELAKEIRQGRRLWTLAMASQEHWGFWTLLAHTVITESSLLYLRWLGCRHAVGLNIQVRDVKECLDFLIFDPRFQPATI